MRILIQLESGAIVADKIQLVAGITTRRNGPEKTGYLKDKGSKKLRNGLLDHRLDVACYHVCSFSHRLNSLWALVVPPLAIDPDVVVKRVYPDLALL